MSLTIKPLTWTPSPSDPRDYPTWRAHISPLRWTIKQLAGGAFVLVSALPEDPNDPSSRHVSLAAAQQVAQEQWETFVRAAVEETP